jgi:putative FmdB family regulatory protein
MPIYEYVCKACGNSFEDLRMVSEADEPAVCPKCGKSGATRKPSVFASGGGGEVSTGSSCGTGSPFS